MNDDSLGKVIGAVVVIAFAFVRWAIIYFILFHFAVKYW